MAFPTISRRRLLLPLILAGLLAGEAAGLVNGTRELFVASAAQAVSASPPSRVHASAAPMGTYPSASGQHQAATNRGARQSALVTAEDPAVAQYRLRPSLGRGATIRPLVAATARAATVLVRGDSTTQAYRGRNHVWIPSLGIDRSVEAFACTRSRPPDNHVYRWGCAGNNNVYLLGHAYSVFKALHDAYVEGRLRAGMKVIYADGNGNVRTYSVTWWKVTRPTASASWAWAAQAKPSMTLQTCVGARSELRLMVRLVATG